MSDHVAVTITVVPGLPGTHAWWPDDRHLAVSALCAHDLPAALEAAAATIRETARS